MNVQLATVRASWLQDKIELIKKCSRTAAHCSVDHFNALYMNMDPIQDCASKREAIRLHATIAQECAQVGSRFRHNIHYLFPFVCMSLLMADSLILFAKNDFKYDCTQLPEWYTHHLMLKQLWYQSDVIMYSVIVQEWFVYGLLLFGRMLEPKCRMYAYPDRRQNVTKIICNGIVWPQNHSNIILNYRARARKVITVTMSLLLIVIFPYYGIGIVANWTNSPRDYVFLAFSPFFNCYSAFGCVYITFFFVLHANYTRIQQNFLLDKLRGLSKQVMAVKTIQPDDDRDDDDDNVATSSSLNSETAWMRFVAINKEIFAFFDLLHAINRFWTPYLSLIFITHIIMEVFMLYGLIFDYEKSDLLTKSYFVYFGIELLVILLSITETCSTIVRNTVRMFKTNCQFAYVYSRMCTPNAVHLAQMSKMISNYKGTRNGFRLLNNYIIDSRMFEVLFFYLSTIFLKVFTDS